MFLHWFLSNIWTRSNWWFSFWISLASVMESLPSFPDCQCPIHLHQVPSRKIWILLLFVLQFYRLQEIGIQRKTEQNLPKFSIELLKGRRYTFTHGLQGNSWIVAVPWASRKLLDCGRRERELRSILLAQMLKNPAMQETPVRSLSWEDSLEKGVATHSSILAWRIPLTEEPGEL